jgi:16S rRNA processing protein RimM
MAEAPGKWVTVGVVGAPHGVRGAVHVSTSLENPADLRVYSPLNLKDGRMLEVATVKPGKAGRATVSFKGVKTRDEAQALTHQELQILRARLPKLKNSGEFYYADLIGLRALKNSGENLGEVIAVHNFGASDIIEIKTSNDTLMVAFSKNFVPEVDLKKGALIVSDAALVDK